MKTRVTVRDAQKGKIVTAGYLDGSTFSKDVTKSKHFMRVVDGYGIQESVFYALRKHRVASITITEQDTGTVYTSILDDWEEHGKVADYGAGKQRFLSVSYMKKA